MSPWPRQKWTIGSSLEGQYHWQIISQYSTSIPASAGYSSLPLNPGTFRGQSVMEPAWRDTSLQTRTTEQLDLPLAACMPIARPTRANSSDLSSAPAHPRYGDRSQQRGFAGVFEARKENVVLQRWRLLNKYANLALKRPNFYRAGSLITHWLIYKLTGWILDWLTDWLILNVYIDWLNTWLIDLLILNV